MLSLQVVAPVAHVFRQILNTTLPRVPGSDASLAIVVLAHQGRIPAKMIATPWRQPVAVSVPANPEQVRVNETGSTTATDIH